MALYKDGDRLTHSKDEAFDKKYEPGVSAPHAGIYRCVKCNLEIGIADGHTLPPQGHHQHPPNLGGIQWQLLVYAQHQR